MRRRNQLVLMGLGAGVVALWAATYFGVDLHHKGIELAGDCVSTAKMMGRFFLDLFRMT